MKKPLTQTLLLATAIFCLSAAESVRAQSTPACEIKKITPTLLPSPQISSSGYTKKLPQGQAHQWLEIDVELDMAQKGKEGPKFAEELTVKYYILLNNKGTTEDGKPTLLTGSVSHTDIVFGKELHAGAFVSPQTLLRFFDGKVPNINQAVTDLGVSVSDSSGVIAQKALKSPVRGDKAWWDNTEDFTEVPGRVLAKDSTPFADLFWDYYLPTKPKAGL